MSGGGERAGAAIRLAVIVSAFAGVVDGRARADVALPPTPVAGTPVPRTFTLRPVTVDPEAAGRFGALPPDATLDAGVSIASESVTIDALRTLVWTRARIALAADRDVHALVVALPMDLAATPGISVWDLRVRVADRPVRPVYREREVTIEAHGDPLGGRNGPRVRKERWLEWTMDVPRSGVVVETSWASPLGWIRTDPAWRAVLGYSTTTGMRWHGRAAPTVTLRVHSPDLEVRPEGNVARRDGDRWELEAAPPSRDRFRLFDGERRTASLRTSGPPDGPAFARPLGALPSNIPPVLEWLDRLGALVVPACPDDRCEGADVGIRGTALLALLEEGATSTDVDVRRATWAARRVLAVRLLDDAAPGGPGPSVTRCVERVGGASQARAARPQRRTPEDEAFRRIEALLEPSAPARAESIADATREIVEQADVRVLHLGCDAEATRRRNVGIAVGVTSASVVLCALAWAVVRRRRRERQTPPPAT